MKTFTYALALTRRMIGRRAVHTMMAGFNQSAIHAE